MTGYMLRPTPNPDRSGRDGTAEHALQRYKGLKPNGHDAIGGMGRSPKARRRNAPTRHAVPAAMGFEPLAITDAMPGMGRSPEPCACDAAIGSIAPRRTVN